MKKFVVLLAVLLVLAGGVWWGRPAYRRWKQERLVAQARAFFGKGDYRNAALSASEVLRVNSADVEACRIMVQVADALRAPAALQWWRRLVELQPLVLANRLELARNALLQGDYTLAAKALADAGKTNQNAAAYHQMAAMVSVALNDIAVAEGHFSAAARLDPTNKLVQLDLAVIHLQAKDQQVVAGALNSLEQLRADPTYRKDALRHLAMAAEHNQDFVKAAGFTKELQADPKASLDDRLMHLTALNDAKSAGFGAYLAQLEGTTAKNGEQANTLAAWLLERGMGDEAVQWLTNLPPQMQTNRPVAMALADCYTARKDWPALQALLQDANWNDGDFLRLAMLSRAAREQRQEFAAQAQWLAAVKAASDRPKPLAALVRMTKRWGWDKEWEELLWLIAQRLPAERWALQTLHQTYLAAGNTRGLLKIYSTMLGYDANDPVAQNNLATVSFLLASQVSRAQDLAREAYQKMPKNEAFAATQAYSLHLQDRTRQGLKVLEALKPDQLEVPSVALYYGVLLAANDESEKATKYLELAEKGQLLPEEKALLVEAKKRTLEPPSGAGTNSVRASRSL